MSPPDSPAADSLNLLTSARASSQALATSYEGFDQVRLVRLSCLALLVSLVTGFGAVGFRDLIGLIHNALFLGSVSFRYDANLFTPPSPWGVWVILVPVAGALAVTFLVTRFAPEARSHGVPEVMDAIYYKGGTIVRI